MMANNAKSIFSYYFCALFGLICLKNTDQTLKQRRKHKILGRCIVYWKNIERNSSELKAGSDSNRQRCCSIIRTNNSHNFFKNLEQKAQNQQTDQ